jgi:hypothetical protein
MIEMPRRSVTRFFIPLIDVLTLMFCIFLLMPMVKPAEERTGFAQAAREERIRQLEAELERLKKQGKGLSASQEEELKKLREELAKTLQQRLVIRVLQIDPQTGRLFCYDEGKRKRFIDSRRAADDLIAADRRSQGSNHDMYYLILYPRDVNSVYPLREDRERFEQWFAGVPHGYDVPGAGPARGGAQ